MERDRNSMMSQNKHLLDMGDFKFLKIMTHGLLITLVLTLVIFFDRTTGREIFITLRSLIIVVLLLLLARNTRRRTKRLIYEAFEEQYKKYGRWGSRYLILDQYSSDIYELSFFVKTTIGIFASAAVSICIGVVADRYVLRMFLTTFFLFILLGCQLEQKYVETRINKINNNF